MSSETAGTIYTIGHSNHPFERFVALLCAPSITVVVDTRSSPYARYSTQFNREPLGASLTRAGIQYLYMGDTLGGRPEDGALYTAERKVRYRAISETPGFIAGIVRLLKGVQADRIALMCAEEDPTDCHRRRLIGEALRVAGVDVRYIRADGSLLLESDLQSEEQAQPRQEYLIPPPQEDQWTSTRSVSRRKAPNSSSASSASTESAGS
jgi:uncharacterized protein (DUF488 family)